MNDISEYVQIVEKHRKKLYKYCFYKVGKDKTLADETFDDVIHVLYKKWDSLVIDDNILAYLYRVADMCARNCKARNQSCYLHNESLEERLEDPLYVDSGAEDKYFLSDEPTEEEYIEEIERSLPEEYRQLFIYRFVQKKTINEIVELTGIPYSSLRLRFSKIEKLVRQKIKEIFK